MRGTCDPAISCEWLPLGEQVIFDADPDVAGIGVIVSFFIGAWLSFAIAILAYFLLSEREDDDYMFRRADVELRAMAKSLFQNTPFTNAILHIRSRVSRNMMKKVCIMFCDQQLITGAAILIMGYSKHCDITQYHFYVAANLSMACFATFQALLPFARSELEDKLKKGWRMAWISVIFACILILNFVIYNDNFLAQDHFGLSMHCVWEKLPGHFTRQLMPYVVIGTLFDVWTFASILLCLYPSILEMQPVAYLVGKLNSVMILPTWFYLQIKERNASSKPAFLWLLLEALVGPIFIIFFTIRELLDSQSMSLTRTFFYLIQSTNAVAWARMKAQKNGREGSEDTWGFGQILPMLLLALPILSLIETLFREY
ncbi:hypothetical protein NW768_010016 [Fusarium equiseti]|uniref:Uncharacterized protein n=1 Tax=Fusarium equiseti TaxID=61235 RepID=A0ABQ8R1P6_FUSEQ|nr:hypothetical protein NW768_010016 [Fusarium equiseti]